MTTVWPNFSRNSKKRRWISSRLCESRLPEGSSANSTAGALTSARAMATRCCSPPESCPGLWSRRDARPIMSSSSAARRSTSARGRRPISPGMQTFSKAVNSASRWWNWKTKPMRSLRNFDRALSPSDETSSPPISTRPLSGRERVPMICKSVVFPAPLAPTMETTSPAATSSETPFSTSSVPKLLCMSVTRIIGGTC